MRAPAVPAPTLGLCRATSHTAPVLPVPAIRWSRPLPDDGDYRLDEWCDTVGPAVVHHAPARAGVVTALAVATWNLHVGAGDVRALLRDVENGTLTGGRRVDAIVLLLQEALRADAAIVASARIRVPGRIRVGRSPGADIVTLARQSNLSLLYVPSMRNGIGTASELPEDRGSAILSTLPVAEPEAIELPFADQRRVVVAARVDLPQLDGTSLSLRVASGHLEPFPGVFGWVTGPSVRTRQMTALVQALNGSVPTVLGIDLNNWFGTRERAYRLALGAFPFPLVSDERATFTAGRRIDHVFLRVPPAWQAVAATAPSRYGSDHHPVVTHITIG